MQQNSLGQNRGGSVMKNKIVIWFGLALILPVLMAACSGSTPAAETEEPKPTVSAPTEEPTIIPPRTGDLAPDFTLPDSNGSMVRLADELLYNRQVILVFYHAYN
jgi:ABC-type transport system substrate-binding protein